MDTLAFWNERHQALGPLRSGGDRGLSEGENYEFYVMRLAKILEFVRFAYGGSRSLRILDAGCGKGAFTDGLSRAGYLVDGVEQSPAALDYARRNHLGTFFEGTIEDFRQNLLYDVVLCIDVLFHILEDDRWEKAVMKLVDCCTFEGVIIVTDTPLASNQSVSNYIRYRSKATYAKLMAPLGFALVHEEPYNFDENSNHYLIFSRTEKYQTS